MVLKFYRAADEMINGRSLLLDLTQRPETKEPSGLRIFAGAFKKKLGLTIVSDRPQGGERVYRIA